MECCTDIKLDEFEFKWMIKRFSLHLECANERNNTFILKSSQFTVGNNTKWHLELHIYGIKDDCNGYIGMFTSCDSCNETSGIWASQKMFIVTSKDEKMESKEMCMQEFNLNTPSNGWEIFYSKKKIMEKADNYLPNDELTIILQIHVINDILTYAVTCHIPEISKNSLSSDFEKLLMDKKFADVTFIMKEKEIKAHKNVLSARSPVFAAMFEHEMKEQNKNEVNIVDISSEIFEKMLHYIYTNEVDNLEDTAWDLLPAADKYQLEDLKNICENTIWKNITVHNATESFILADRYDAKPLLESIRNFMSLRMVEVMKTEQFQMIQDKDPKTTAMIFRNTVMASECDEEICENDS